MLRLDLSKDVRMSLSNSLTGVFNLYLIRRLHQFDKYEKVSARVNVLYGTNRFENLCDDDTQYLTVISLIKKPLWQIEFLPASLTATPAIVDISSLYKLTTEFKDYKFCLGLVIGGCEDEIIIEFLFVEQYHYFRKIFEMYISREPSDGEVEGGMEQEEVEGEGESEENTKIGTQIIDSPERKRVTKIDQNKTEVFESTLENITQWLKLVYVPKSPSEVTSLFLYLKEKKILKDFRKLLLGVEMERLLEVVENYEFDPRTIDAEPNMSVLKHLLVDDPIRINLKKHLLVMMLDRSFNFYRVLRKRIFQMYGEEAFSKKHTVPTIKPSELEKTENELIFDMMWLWNIDSLNDNILSLLCFKMDTADYMNRLLRAFHQLEEDVMEKMEFDAKIDDDVETENTSKSSCSIRNDPSILINIISKFNADKSVRLEEICFELHIRVFHRDLYYEFLDLYYEILPIEDEYFDAYNSKEETEELIIKLEREKIANRKVIDEFEDFDDTQRIDLMMGIHRSIKSRIEGLQTNIKRFDRIIQHQKSLLVPLDEKMALIVTKFQFLRTKFMLSRRRLTRTHEYIHERIVSRSFQEEVDFSVNLNLSLFQFKNKELSRVMGKSICMTEPVLSYLTISRYCRLHFFRDVSLAMVSTRSTPTKNNQYDSEMDYEEVISVDMLSGGLVMTTSLNFLDVVSDVSKRIISINVNSFFSQSKINKKNMLKTKIYSFPLDTSYEFTRIMCGESCLDCSMPYPEVGWFIESLISEAGKNLQLMEMSRIRRFRIDVEFFNKFLVVLGDFFVTRKRLFMKGSGGKIRRRVNSGKSKRSIRHEKVVIFTDHKILDEVYKKILELDDQFKINHPGVFQLLKGFDNSFWILDEKERYSRYFGLYNHHLTTASTSKGFKTKKERVRRIIDHSRPCPFHQEGRAKNSEGQDEEGPAEPTKSCASGEDLSTEHSKEVNLALIELLDTQEFYVDGLETFNDTFLTPLERSEVELEQEEQEEEENSGEVEENKSIKIHVTPELIIELRKIRSVIEIDTLFLSSLKSVISRDQSPDCNNNLTRIEEIIEKILLHSFALKGYATYMCAYPYICDKFSEEEKTNENFKSFLVDVESKLRDQKKRTYTSRSFLLQPIQRIPRIRMLIERVIKRVGKEYKEHRMLMKAFEKIETMARYSNSKMKEMKNLQKLREDERWLGFHDLVIPGVRVYKDETIKVRKIRNLQNKKKVVRNTRVQILTHLIVVYYKGKKKKAVVMELEKAVVMKEIIDKDDRDAKVYPFGLIVKSQNVGFSFCFEEVSERDEWGKVISEIIGKSKMAL